MVESRTWLAPVVVQTSSMDCGPACLASLFAGFGVRVSYEGLRDVCRTGQDGTSINVLEDTATELGLRVRQVLVPVEHAIRYGTGTLPAILLTRLPGDVGHFVVGWRRWGRWVEVMDPAVGRRWMSVAAAEQALLPFTVSVPAAAWREYAGSADFLEPLAERLCAVGVPEEQIRADIDAAAADPGWRGLAGLDAECRRLAASKGRGADAGPAGDLRRGQATGEYWCVAPDPEDDEALLFTGAVLLIAEGMQAEVTPPAPVAEAVFRPDPAVSGVLAGLLGRRRVRAAAAAIAAFVVCSLALAGIPLAIQVAEVRGVPVEVGRLAVAAALLAAGLTASMVRVRTAGRQLEAAIRAQIAVRLPRLPHRFFASRPASDLVERSHALAEIRELPLVAARGVSDVLRVVIGTAILVAASGDGRAWLIGAAALAPIALARGLGEMHHRVRTVAGALNSHQLDAALGITALRGVGAGDALRFEYDLLLGTWRRSEWSFQRAGALLFTAADVLVWIPLIIVLQGLLAAGAGPATVLAVAVVGLWTTDAGQSLGAAMQEVPRLAAIARRAAVLLTARLDPDPETAARVPSGPMALDLRSVTQVAEGRTILDGIDLRIPAGQHVAVVGASGSGKSSILRLVVGLTEPSEGEVQVNGVPIGAAEMPQLRARAAWVDPASALWSGPAADVIGGVSAQDPGSEWLQAARACDLGDQVERLQRDGVLERAVNLSGGQAQRLRLARAWARRGADLVVLDEPGQGMERERRTRLVGVLRERFAASTLLCATHDVSEALGFDRVLVVEDGRIVADGAPAALAEDVDGPLGRMLAAERRIQALWADPRWQTITVRDGTVTGHDQPVPTSPAAGPSPVAETEPPTSDPVPAPDRSVTASPAPWFAASLAFLVVSVGLGALGWVGLYRAATGTSEREWVVPLLVSVLLFGPTAWCFGRARVLFGVRLRTKLLDGILRQDPDLARREGPGMLTGRILDSDTFESLAMRGAALIAVSMPELVLAGLAATAVSGHLLALLLCWLVLVAAVTARTVGTRTRWADRRSAATARMAERLLGHETELVYGAPAQPDGVLPYLAATRTVDYESSVLRSLLPVGWLAAALGMTVWLRPDDVLPALAAALLGYLAIDHVAEAAEDLATAAAAYRGFRHLLIPAPGAPTSSRRSLDGAIRARGLTYTYPSAGRPALAEASVDLRPGARVLVMGASGSGKTTLSGLLGGVRAPESGQLDSGAVLVPQAGDNHLFRASIAFNLMCARPWPPTEQDIKACTPVIDGLLLREVVDRMPMRAWQPIGECGWRLSHGETARVQLGRALLADCPAIILDESFAALDPITLEHILEVLHTRAETLVVVVHP